MAVGCGIIQVVGHTDKSEGCEVSDIYAVGKKTDFWNNLYDVQCLYFRLQ